MKKFFTFFVLCSFFVFSLHSSVFAFSEIKKHNGESVQGILGGEKSLEEKFFDANASTLQMTPFFIFWHSKIILLGLGVASLLTYPSAKDYKVRTRDTNRQWAIRNVALALSTYNIDNWSFPKALHNGCIPQELEGLYLNEIPTDPVSGRINYGCVDSLKANSYAYRVVNFEENGQKTSYALVSATMENVSTGNSPYTIDEVVKNPQLIKRIMNWEFKWKWKYYIQMVDWY